MDWTTERSNPGKVKNVLLFHIVQTGFGTYSAKYPILGGGISAGRKRQGRESGNSPPTSDDIKKILVCTSTPRNVFME
jgi:hypothetical protein